MSKQAAVKAVPANAKVQGTQGESGFMRAVSNAPAAPKKTYYPQARPKYQPPEQKRVRDDAFPDEIPQNQSEVMLSEELRELAQMDADEIEKLVGPALKQKVEALQPSMVQLEGGHELHLTSMRFKLTGPGGKPVIHNGYTIVPRNAPRAERFVNGFYPQIEVPVKEECGMTAGAPSQHS